MSQDEDLRAFASRMRGPVRMLKSGVKRPIARWRANHVSLLARPRDADRAAKDLAAHGELIALMQRIGR